MSKILFFGDIRADNEEIAVDPKLIALCSLADIVIANLEGPIIITPEERIDKKGVAHANGFGALGLLEKLQVTHLLLGNNHIFDYGPQGLDQTDKFCSERSIKHAGARIATGAGEYRLVLEDEKICIYSFAHHEGDVASIYDNKLGPFVLPEMEDLVSEIKALVELDYSVFVVYHGGEEYFNTPWPRRLGWSFTIQQAGAKIVIGTHSHSPQPVFFSNKGFVAPGLGNTFFVSEGQRRNSVGNSGQCLLYDTESCLLRVFLLRSDIYRKEIRLEAESGLTSMSKLETMAQDWVKEARLSVTGRLNRIRTTRKDEWWKRMLRPIYVFLSYSRRVIFKGKNVRDRDILISTIPFCGPSYARKIYKAGARNLRF